MKNVRQITFAAIAAGLLTSIAIVNNYSSNCLQFIWIPYVILFVVTYVMVIRNASAASNVAILITTCIISALSALAYGEVSFGTSHSSTEGLIFFILPIFSIGLIPIIYLASKCILGLIIHVREFRK
jgi:hypothetical protein